MHYRNGREAKNGDKIVMIGAHGDTAGTVIAMGILFDAVPGNDFCNGQIAPLTGGPVAYACLIDCLHAEDLTALLKEKGLHQRPAGK